MTLAVGAECTTLEKYTGKFRRYYAEKHGWDYITVCDPPAGGWRGIFMEKLKMSTRMCQYDLVAFMDCDSLVNPAAPCLSQFNALLPQGSFAAGQPLPHYKRKNLYPDLPDDYYVEQELERGWKGSIRDRTLFINSGLLLYRPREVAKRWSELAEMDSLLWEEARLNVYEVQNDLCMLLPPEWHILWEYHRTEHYPFLCRTASSVLHRVRNKLVDILFAGQLERDLMLITLRNNCFVHFAFNRGYYRIVQQLCSFGPSQIDDRTMAALHRCKFYFSGGR